MKVNTLAAALKAEVRRLAAKEVQKGLRSLRAMQRQMKKLRLAARANRRGLRSVERSFGRLEARVPSGGRRGRGARLSGEDIRALRARLQMTREQFSRVICRRARRARMSSPERRAPRPRRPPEGTRASRRPKLRSTDRSPRRLARAASRSFFI